MNTAPSSGSDLSFFPYSWHIQGAEIHVYGFEADETVSLVRIQDFTPYVYLKLPLTVQWSVTQLSRLVTVLKRHAKIFKTCLMHKRPLYYAHVHYENDQPKYDYHPYLFVAFASEQERKHFAYSVPRRLSVSGMESFDLEMYEQNATPVLQLTCMQGVSTADWFRVRNLQYAPEPLSRLAREYAVTWKCITPLAAEVAQTLPFPKPLILSYDIECNFHDPNKFSDGSHANDIVFQISCVFARQSAPRETWDCHLLTLGQPDPQFLPGVTVHTFRHEFQLLMGFQELVVARNPQILIGYNIFKFDIPFLYKRAINERVHDDFVRQGCTRDKCRIETIRWSSSAYSNQEMTFIDLQGRMTIDLLTLIQRDFNLESYKLDAVAEKFVGAGKDPLNHYDIFMCYAMGMRETQEHGVSRALGLVGKYCVKDSVLVMELFEKFQYWYSLTEMAKICQVPHSHLYLYGQQLKVFSQVYKYCYAHNIVVESGRFKPDEDEQCMGAYVFTPEPGLYDNVVSFDFQSLYPSIIISHNIDFSTLVQPEDVSRIGAEHLTHIEWGEHINCPCPHTTRTKEKEIRCKNYSFHWLKDPVGVLPTIIRNLLDARKVVRNQMKNVDPHSLFYDILNKRQLAYKVSSNSMYGAMTTRKGYLPFLPGGMCVTAVGRRSIEQVSEIIQREHKGEIVYGDTDSNYVRFPHLTSLTDIWSHSMHVSEEVSKRFPEPMRLEFEDHIYARYLILSKKRYLYFTCSPETGELSSKIENKGVLLKRRDNSKVVRDIYEKIIRMVLHRCPEIDVIGTLLYYLSLLCASVPPLEDYQMSKSVKTVHSFVLASRDTKTLQYGDYVVPRLKDDDDARAKQLAEKGVATEEAFYQAHLPGAVQLALRMRARGQTIESGSRLLYVVSRRVSHKASVSDKMEEIEYFKLHYSKRMIDVLHYLHLLINPIEEVLTVMYGTRKYQRFVKDYYKYRIKYDLVMEQLYRIAHPIVLQPQ